MEKNLNHVEIDPKWPSQLSKFKNNLDNQEKKHSLTKNILKPRQFHKK